MFDYDPKTDQDLQCKEIGLGFKTGEVLQVISQDEKDWWQVK
jgi:hypothetical protein